MQYNSSERLTGILFVKCQSRVGGRKATGKPLDERIGANYRNLCYGMLSAANAGALIYDNDGFAEYCTFFDEIEPQLTPDVGELAFMGEWAGKLPGNMTRFAGLIHCIAAFEQGKDPLDTPINAEEARAAVELARFYLAHAKTVYSEQAEPESIANVRYLWERIKSIKSLSFSKGELTRKVQNKVDFDYAESLQRLIDYGYIRIEVAETGRGRPSERICVNPKAVKKSEKSEINPGRNNKFTLFTQNTNIPNVNFVGPTDNGQRPAPSRIIPLPTNDPAPGEGRVTFTI